MSRQQPGQEARPCPPSSTCEDLLCLPTGNTVTQPTATWPTRKTPPHPPPKSLTRKLPSPLGHMPSVRFQNRVPKTPGPFVRLTVTGGVGGTAGCQGLHPAHAGLPGGQGARDGAQSPSLPVYSINGVRVMKPPGNPKIMGPTQHPDWQAYPLVRLTHPAPRDSGPCAGTPRPPCASPCLVVDIEQTGVREDVFPCVP